MDAIWELDSQSKDDGESIDDIAGGALTAGNDSKRWRAQANRSRCL